MDEDGAVVPLDAIEQRLAALRGQPLRGVGRAADMAWWQFGEDVVAPTRGDPQRIRPRYALHVQCAFRLLGPDGRVVVGSEDIFVDPASPRHAPDDFDWDVAGANLYDHQARELMASRDTEATALRVVEAHGDHAGGLTIVLTEGFRLEVLPATAVTREHWRFFEMGSEAAHLVVFEEE